MYEFSMGALFLGLLILAIGGLIVLFHQKLANNLGSGMASYERFKFWGLITCGVGIIIMTSLYTIPLNYLINTLFGR